MAKELIKTIRLSQEHIELINTLPGTNFTQRMECLLDYYFLSQSRLEADLADLRIQKAHELQKITRLKNIAKSLDAVEASIRAISEQVTKIQSQINNLDSELPLLIL